MQPVNVDLPDHTEYDEWEGMTIGPVLINGSQPVETLASCKLYFRRKGHSTFKMKTSPGSGEGVITIDDAATWEITIPEQVIPLTVGRWDWDFKAVDASGSPLTLYSGVLKITESHSNDND